MLHEGLTSRTIMDLYSRIGVKVMEYHQFNEIDSRRSTQLDILLSTALCVH